MGLVTTLTAVPDATYIGDTLLFEIAESNYPASGWTLDYSFRATQGSAIDLTGTASGESHLFSVAPATTATWLPGTYYGVGRATDAGGGKVTFWRGQLEIKPDLSTQEDNYDARSWAKRCLDKIEAVIEGKASKDVLNSTIAGQSIGRMSPEQLFAMHQRFASEVASEEGLVRAETILVVISLVCFIRYGSRFAVHLGRELDQPHITLVTAKDFGCFPRDGWPQPSCPAQPVPSRPNVCRARNPRP